jgi:hypothetical protein
VVAASFALSASWAPIQCPSPPRPELAREDDAPEALFRLAERFKAQGNEPARVETLRFIMERYPASRLAVTAKYDLEDSGQREH